MYHFYALYSLKDHKLYKGTTSNVPKRFIRHNNGGNKSTAHRKPFVLIYVETLESKSQALSAERYYKSPEGGAALREKLIAKGILDENGRLR